MMEILLFTKDNHWCQAAIRYAKMIVPEIEVHTSVTQNSFPVNSRNCNARAVISFLSPWIIPSWLLKRSRGKAINFHPASLEYPGSGCYNFALYHNVTEYGATCHHMKSIPDTGDIIEAIRFPVFQNDSVATLQTRTLDHMLVLFYKIFPLLAKGENLPNTGETWHCKPYKRSELEALCLLDPGMSAQEINHRIRATRYPGRSDPRIVLHGQEFVLKVKGNE